MSQINSEFTRESDSLLNVTNDSYGTTNNTVNDTGKDNMQMDNLGKAWNQLKPIGSEDTEDTENTENDILDVSKKTTTSIIDIVVEKEDVVPYKLYHLPTMKIDDMTESDKIKLYENLNLSISFSLYSSMKYAYICEICRCTINDGEGLHIIKPEIAHKVYDMYHCEGDVMGCKKCYADLYSDKRFIKAMNIIYMMHRRPYFNWYLKDKQEYIKVERSNGDIEDDWKIDENKCLLIKNRSDITDIGLYCHKDTKNGLPYKVVMYEDIKKLNPWVKIMIDEIEPKKYTENILCENVVRDIKNIYEKYKSLIN